MNTIKRIRPVILSIAITLAMDTVSISAQTNGMQNMPNMNSGQISMGNMVMGGHMKMTAKRQPQPGDQEKSQRVADAARKVCEKYKDYKVALADGFHIFMPNVPQHQYHFTNPDYAHEAAEHFNPEHPTSLLYEKGGNGYKLVGVMYTAPKWTNEDELNARIPLSIVQWHEHVNLCFPPPGSNPSMNADHKFGFHGAIATEEACESAGGRFVPQMFGWMVHVYPFEHSPANIWSVTRQMGEED